MSEIITGILGTTCVFSMSFILCKLCDMRSDVKDVSSQYILIKKDHYNSLKEKLKTKQKENIINESPLPSYSEHAPLISTIKNDDFFNELYLEPSVCDPNSSVVSNDNI